MVEIKTTVKSQNRCIRISFLAVCKRTLLWKLQYSNMRKLSKVNFWRCKQSKYPGARTIRHINKRHRLGA
jgi:hypothetical protein